MQIVQCIHFTSNKKAAVRTEIMAIAIYHTLTTVASGLDSQIKS